VISPTPCAAAGVGTVRLVGAGPGDPRLITVRGLELLRRADVVVHDRLVDGALLDEASPHAERIFVGKRRGCHAASQDAINAVLVDRARAGLEVVRLKGGDPFVFGRGGEEAAALAAAGVPLEIVPGVSSVLAAPAAAGIPVTHRGVASSFTVLSGHDPAAGPAWTRAAAGGDTLVLLMGLETLPVIARRLIASGRPADTPAAVIGSATTAEQVVVVGRLADIAVRARGVPSPAVVVVGEVVRLGRTGGDRARPSRHLAVAVDGSCSRAVAVARWRTSGLAMAVLTSDAADRGVEAGDGIEAGRRPAPQEVETS
jgi:uroporphyrin-III C-methyltransferase